MRTILFIFAVVFGNIAELNAQIITTIAGTGALGYTGDGGPATSATIKYPTDICFDKHGNIFICDNGNHCIRKIDAASGIITTIAGTGISGFSGDGGLATSAKLSFPTSIAVDSLDNFYIGDAGNYRIRKINALTGIISTITGNGTSGGSGDGGLASSAKISGALGMFIDDSTNLYFADPNNHRVRKISTASGIIKTVVGTGLIGFSGDGGSALSAQINYPDGVAIDDSGNVFVPDQMNNRIRKVNASNGNIYTIAGTGTIGYSGDGGQATLANLYWPNSIALDIHGNIYISFYKSHRIRKIDKATGIISTIAGLPTSGSSGDGGLATLAKLNEPYYTRIDKSGNIYIADHTNNKIRKISAGNSVGIEYANKKPISIFPNPANDILFMELNDNVSNIDISVFDVNERLLFSKTLNTSSSTIDIKQLSPGIYFYKIYQNNKFIYQGKFYKI